MLFAAGLTLCLAEARSNQNDQYRRPDRVFLKSLQSKASRYHIRIGVQATVKSDYPGDCLFMRLLNTRTGRFHWFEDPRQVRYAILSHVWSKDPRKPEQSYQDVLLRIDATETGKSILEDPCLSDKIRSFCRVAREHGFDFGWVDSCCIDRTSSSELSEALTSMYDWYRCADLCLAFLHDVHVKNDTDSSRRDVQFRSSLWFLRGWTLQELLAPSLLLFLSSTWDVIGSKQISAALVASVTNIDQDVLTFKRSLHDVSVACKMSWAASRRTTREEDEAYCLMGIFGVSIPIMYGEGRYAFVRLQEEIIRTIPDQSIFAWGRILQARVPLQFFHPDDSAVASAPNLPLVGRPSSNEYLLASSPRDFEASSSIIHLSRDQFAETLGIPPESTYQVFTVTAHGIHLQLPLVVVISRDLHEISPTYLALLACETQHDGHLLALLLRSQDENVGPGFLVGAGAGHLAQAAAGVLGASDLKDWYYRAVYLSIPDIDRIRRRRLFRMADLYIPHRPSPDASETKRDQRIFRSIQESQYPFDVVLSSWSRSLLSLDGSRVLEPERDEDSIVLRDRYLNVHLTPGVVISYKAIHINIQIGQCKCSLDRRFQVVPGVLVWSPHAESSLEKRFKDVPHLADHPVHIHSWAFRDGVASTSVDLQPFSSPRERITVRLTLYHPSDQSSAQAYRLGVEVTSSQVDVQSSSVASRLRNYRAMVYDPALNYSSASHERGDLQATSRMLSDILPVRGRTRSRSFSAPYSVEPYDFSQEEDEKPPMSESPDDLVRAVQLPESPPVTETHSSSSDHPANDWHGYGYSAGSLPGPRHYGPQGPPDPDPRRSLTWSTFPQLPDEGGQAWLPRSRRRRSFEDGRVQASDHGTGAPFNHARDDSDIVSVGGRIASTQQRPWSPSTAMSGDVTRPYPMDLRDTPTRLRSSDWAGRNLDEKDAGGIRGLRPPIPAVVRADSPVTLAQGDSSLEVSNIPGRRYHGVRTQPFQGAVGNGAEKMVAFDPQIDSEPGEPPRGRQVHPLRPNAAREARARSVPRPSSPEPPGMGRGWLPPWNVNGGEYSPAWPDALDSNVPPPAQTSLGEGRTQIYQPLPLASAAGDARPSRRDTPLSTSSPSEHGHGGDVQVPSRAGVAQLLVAGRDGRGDGVRPVLNGGSTVPSSSQFPLRDVGADSLGMAPPRSVAPTPPEPVAIPVAGQPGEGGRGAGGTLKEKRRMSGFVRRLPFFKRFASDTS